MSNIWGYCRETKNSAIKDSNKFGINCSGLDEYLNVIFPNVTDWVHDKSVGKLEDGRVIRSRPDYRSDQLKLIVEFDGIQHYSNPEQIEKDLYNTKIYESLGYKVVRIPYFIQLTKKTVEKMFGVNLSSKLMREDTVSIATKYKNTPAYLCPKGIKRMAKEFINYPEQYFANIDSLLSEGDYFTDVSMLVNECKID